MKYFCTIVFSAVFCIAFSQDIAKKHYSFGGIIRNISDDKPLCDAGVLLRGVNNNVLFYGLTDSEGKYQFSYVSTESLFFIEFSRLGFQTTKTKIEFLNNKLISNSGIVYLKENAELNPVVITAKQLVKATETGYVYDVSSDTLAKVTKIVNLLDKLPFIELDIHNKPQYFGRSGSITYLLNGKRTILFSNSDLVMKMISGKNITSIELIPNPLPPYDRSDAVINIVTKKSLFEGILIGTSVIGYSTNNLNISPEISLTTNDKKNSIVFSFTKSESLPLFNTSTNSIRESLTDNKEIIPGTGIITHSEESSDYSSTSISGSYSRTIGKSQSITFGLAASQSNNSSIVNSSNLFESNPLNNIFSKTQDSSTGNQYSFSVGYSNGVYRGKEYSINYSFGVDNSNNSIIQENNILGTPSIVEKWGAKNNYMHTLSSNFNIPISQKQSLNFSASYSLQLLKENLKQQTESGNYSLDYIQNQLNIETGYSFRIKKKSFSIRGALNYFDYNGENIYNQINSPLNYSNLHFVPSVTFSVIPRLGKTFKIAYSQLLVKPINSQLSPYIDNSSPLYIFTGNPDLKPTVINFLDLNFGYQKRKHTFSGILSGSYSSNPIQLYSYVNEEGITVSSFKNIGIRKDISLRLYYRCLFSRSFNITSSVQYTLRYNKLYESYHISYLDWSLSGIYSITSQHKLSASLGIEPNSSSMSGQSVKTFSSISNSISYSGSSKNMRLSYSITLNNIGDFKRTNKSLKQYQSNQVYTERIGAGMNASVKVSYMFGKIRD